MYLKFLVRVDCRLPRWAALAHVRVRVVIAAVDPEPQTCTDEST